MIDPTRCAGSLSSSVRLSQAKSRSSAVSHCETTVVFPYPAGATMSATGASALPSRRETRRSRGTRTDWARSRASVATPVRLTFESSQRLWRADDRDKRWDSGTAPRPGCPPRASRLFFRVARSSMRAYYPTGQRPTTLTFSVFALVLGDRPLRSGGWFYAGALGITLAIGVVAAFVVGDAAANGSSTKAWVAVVDIVAGVLAPGSCSDRRGGHPRGASGGPAERRHRRPDLDDWRLLTSRGPTSGSTRPAANRRQPRAMRKDSGPGLERGPVDAGAREPPPAAVAGRGSRRPRPLQRTGAVAGVSSTAPGVIPSSSRRPGGRIDPSALKPLPAGDPAGDGLLLRRRAALLSGP